MNTMKYRGYTARIDYDPNAHILVGTIVGMSAKLTFHGAAVQELRDDFEFAVNHYLAACAAEGVKPERQSSGKLIIRIPPETHAQATVAAAAEAISLNEWIVRCLSNAVVEKAPM